MTVHYFAFDPKHGDISFDLSESRGEAWRMRVRAMLLPGGVESDKMADFLETAEVSELLQAVRDGYWDDSPVSGSQDADEVWATVEDLVRTYLEGGAL